MNQANQSQLLRAALLGALFHVTLPAQSSPSSEEFYTTARQGETTEQQKQADQLRLQTMTSIEGLLKQKRGDTARNFELYMRLADLYAERHDYLRDLEISRFETTYDAWTKGGKKGKEPTLDNSESKAQLTKAANAYRDLVRQYPRHARTDEALFTLAKTLVRLDNDNAELYFKQLFDNHPNSRLLVDAHVAAGDFYFERHQITKAIDHYKSAMNDKEHGSYPYAVYKLGWSYYNAPAKKEKDSETNLQKALLAFKLVIHVAARDKQFAGRINLKEEAIKDLIMVYADLGETEESFTYFKEIGEKDAFYDLLQRLGRSLAEQGKTKEATVVLERLLKEAPSRPGISDAYKLLAEMRDQEGQRPQVLEVMTRMYNDVVATSGVWHRATKDRPEELTKAKTLAQETTYKFAVRYHRLGLDSKDKTFLVSAADFYDFYLTAFGNTEESYDVRYYLADLQFDQGRYQQSAMNFMSVSNEKLPDGKYVKDAALNGIVAAHKLSVEQDKNAPDLPPAGKVPAPVQLTMGKALLISAIDNYARILPQDGKTAGLLAQAADVQFAHGYYDHALARMQTIIDSYTKTEYAVSSAKTIMGYYLTSEQYENAISWHENFVKTPAAQERSISSVVMPLYRDAVFKRGEQLESGKKFAQAATLFERFQKEFPGDRDSDRALYNAVQNHLRAAEPEKALIAGKNLLGTYAQSKFRSDIIIDVATTEESLGQFEQAADSFYMMVKEFSRDERTPSSMMNAALIWRKLGQTERSTKAYLAFTRMYPKSKLADEAWFNLAEAYTEQNEPKAAVEAYETYLTRPGVSNAILAEARAIDIKTRNGLFSAGRTGLVDFRRRLLQTPPEQNYEARSIIAKLMFDSLATQHKRFATTAMNPDRDISQQAANQQRELESLVKSYENVIAVGSPEFVVASLYQMGDLHEAFYLQLFNAKAPTGMNEKDVFKFRSDLEAAAFPLRDNAYQFYETAFKRSAEVETFTSWTQKTYQKMAELAPGKHPPLKAKWFSPSYLGLELYHQPDLKKVSLMRAGE